MKIQRLLVISLALGLTIPVVTVSAAERIKVDPAKSLVAGLGLCQSKEQLDCVESIEVISASGKKLIASQISFTNEAEVDDQGQTVESGRGTWSYQMTSGATNTFSLTATLTTPEFVVSGSEDQVELSGPEEESSEESQPSAPSSNVSLDTRFFEPKLELTILFAEEGATSPSLRLAAGESIEVTMRTSWLQVEDVYISGKGANVKMSPITDGNRITLSASEVLLFQVQKMKNQITGSVKEIITPIPTISFALFHPKKSVPESNCTATGFRLISTNGTSVSLAEENAVNSLLFKASGMTKKDDGSPNLGTVLISIPVAWARCKDPNSDFSFGEKFAITVTSNLGAPKMQSAKSAVSVQGGKIEIKVEDFEFAKSEILVSTDAKVAADRRVAEAKAKAEAEAKAKAEAEAEAKAKAEAEAAAKAKAEAEAKAKAEAEAKAKAESTKRISITCVKGKSTKKVTAVKPKCPSGYKKR